VVAALRTVLIRRWLTIFFLLLASVAIVATTVWTSGKSYSKVDATPFDDIKLVANRLATRPISTQTLAVIIMPIVGNILLFVPWGFFTFIAFYSVDRPTVQTYLLTVLLGLTFTLSIEAWQYFLPSRVADINDVIWNTGGSALGAILGHMRLRVRFQFD
jgi:glycopeptide antibiotics resistance protein